MPKFFVPHADTPEMTEETYLGFVKNSLPHKPNHLGRLFRISFTHHKWNCVAEVGQEIKGWPENAGKVLAIVGTPTLILVHTVLRGALKDGPILVSQQSARELVYFDDFPAPA